MSQIKEPAEFEIKVGLSLKDVVTALRGLSDEDREFFVENILAATSPEYLESIREAREDYKEGKTIPFEKAFKE